MRNNHIFKGKIKCWCPKEGCGAEFFKEVVVEYVTNEKGDVIEQHMREKRRGE